MGAISRYIFRATFGAFLVVLVSLTMLMWITQVIRDLDLVTNQGQGVLTFLGISALLLPLLIMIIAPIAFMVAMVYVLNKLSVDSELIVMNAAGIRPWQLFRPFFAVGLLVALLVGVLAAYGSPEGLRTMNQRISEIRTDLVTRIVQPGRFVTIMGGLTFHIRERLANGRLLGILIDDQRDPKERATVVAEQGDVFTNDRGSYLLLSSGSVQRQKIGDRDPSIIEFDQYAFNLSQLSPSNAQNGQKYSARERYLWELYGELYGQNSENPSLNERPELIQAELHDRIIAPFFPLVIAVLTFTYLGTPRTTRQGRTLSLFLAIGAVTILRASGFVGILMGSRVPAALLGPYVVLIAAFAFGYWGISRGAIFEPPEFIVDSIYGFIQRFAGRYSRES
jgi:lipopolysaccharide export system permease protein